MIYPMILALPFALIAAQALASSSSPEICSGILKIIDTTGQETRKMCFTVDGYPQYYDSVEDGVCGNWVVTSSASGELFIQDPENEHYCDLHEFDGVLNHGFFMCNNDGVPKKSQLALASTSRSPALCSGMLKVIDTTGQETRKMCISGDGYYRYYDSDPGFCGNWDITLSANGELFIQDLVNKRYCDVHALVGTSKGALICNNYGVPKASQLRLADDFKVGAVGDPDVFEWDLYQHPTGGMDIELMASREGGRYIIVCGDKPAYENY
ncbi:MAG: hypothetical protein M1829_004488 [Trizodia sp. TS-e1964]|nr:MAG: hypothetical protein M1829_004488 [Trizodia sp. TS-e1964]